MSLDDLDLVFEDEEENKKKRKETVDYDENLEFHSLPVPKPRVEPPSIAAAVPKPPQSEIRPPDSEGQIRKIEEARRPQNNSLNEVVAKPMTQGTAALKREVVTGQQGPEISLEQQMTSLQIESQVKVALAEFKVDFLSDILSDMKLMEHQVGQLLARIHAKNPDSKNEVLMIKKIMSDFMAKKRK